MTRSDGSAPRLTAPDVRRLCGDISDDAVAAILATGGDLAALETALAWLAGDDEHTDERHLAPSGAAGQIHEILAAAEDFDEH